MKSRMLLIAAVIVMAGCATAPVRAEPPPQAGVTIGAFESSLVPYGEWIVVARYGRVWRPLQIAVGWQPYLYGEWAWTDEGWFWVTDEPWGWATYHYGRWTYDPVLGWLWVPGFVWGPAWVAWRITDGFVGWAPLYPEFTIWWTDSYPVEPRHWIFVPTRTFVGARIDRVALPPWRAAPLVRSSRPAPPATAGRVSPAPPFGGPPRRVVEEHVGRPVTSVRIVAAPTPADARRAPERGTVSVYRPAPAPQPRRVEPGAPGRPAPEPGATARAAPPPTAEPSPRPAETSRRPEREPAAAQERSRGSPQREPAKEEDERERPARR